MCLPNGSDILKPRNFRKFLDWLVTGNIPALFCFQHFGERCFISDEPMSFWENYF